MNGIELAKCLNGVNIIGRLLTSTENEIELIPYVLMGEMDDELYHGFFLLTHGTEMDYRQGDEVVQSSLEKLKRQLRRFVQGVFSEVERELAREQALHHAAVIESLKVSNTPHERGTVAEISKVLGISKSEVRRRKADGTLEELFQKLAL